MDLDLVKLIETAGIAGLMFAAYYLLHVSSWSAIKESSKAASEAFASEMKMQKEMHERQIKLITESHEKVYGEMNEREERNYNLQKEQIESLQLLCGSLSRIENKIDGNHWCPMVKGAMKDE